MRHEVKDALRLKTWFFEVNRGVETSQLPDRSISLNHETAFTSTDQNYLQLS